MEFTITMVGTAPLLMHSGRLANPLDPAVKAIKQVSSKRKKTDEDHETLAMLEHRGSLYIDPDVGPFIPGDNIFRCLWDAAKKFKLGVKVKEGLFITTDVNPIAYNGPRDADGLWNDKNFVHMWPAKVGQSRVMRTRPVFREWRTSADGWIDPSILDVGELEQIVDAAGRIIGLGDWRPKHGRFEATVKTNGK